MIDIQQATEIVLSHARTFGQEELALEQCRGRILLQDIKADRDFPPFTQVRMDGIAIQWEAYEAGQRQFPVQATQAAGSPQMTLENPKACLEVMTGAVLPKGADTVIRYEDVDIVDGIAHIHADAKVKAKQNAHPQGLDRKKGDLIVKAGTRLSPAEIGVAATVGLPKLKVAKMPTAVIVSTGDELVEVHETPELHQIRSSNSYTIQMALSRWGVQADRLHIDDQLEATKAALKACIAKYDMILLSGGVSKGKFDYVPAALEALGVKKHFHKVKQRPGKPFWFGSVEGSCTVFALPGNPVSSFMCTHRYIRPWLRKSLGLEPMGYAYAVLAENFAFKADLTYFLQVQTHYDPASGRLMAQPVEGKGSGDLANLVDADAFLELPRGRDEFLAEEVFPVIFYRDSM
jgi:molybdopterin molybdotransferase